MSVESIVRDITSQNNTKRTFEENKIERIKSAKMLRTMEVIDLIRHSDQAMYKAKNTGQNRFVVYSKKT